jgi:hypothetical protein
MKFKDWRHDEEETSERMIWIEKMGRKRAAESEDEDEAEAEAESEVEGGAKRRKVGGLEDGIYRQLKIEDETMEDSETTR